VVVPGGVGLERDRFGVSFGGFVERSLLIGACLGSRLADVSLGEVGPDHILARVSFNALLESVDSSVIVFRRQRVFARVEAIVQSFVLGDGGGVLFGLLFELLFL